jgi:DNA repair exonuclease SbcCD ATPase subunit
MASESKTSSGILPPVANAFKEQLDAVNKELGERAHLQCTQSIVRSDYASNKEKLGALLERQAAMNTVMQEMRSEGKFPPEVMDEIQKDLDQARENLDECKNLEQKRAKRMCGDGSDDDNGQDHNQPPRTMRQVIADRIRKLALQECSLENERDGAQTVAHVAVWALFLSVLSLFLFKVVVFFGYV